MDCFATLAMTILSFAAFLTSLSRAAQRLSSHPYFDQPRAVFGDSFRQRADQFIRGGDRAARNAHALGERYKGDDRAVDLEHIDRALSRLPRAAAAAFSAHDLTNAA